MAFFGQRRVGELTSRVSTDIAQIEGALIDALPQLCRQSVFLLGGITLISLTSGRLTLVMLGTLPILIASAVFFGRRLRRYSRETQDQLAATNTIVEETLQAIASVNAFANEAFEQRRYDRANAGVLAGAEKKALEIVAAMKATSPRKVDIEIALLVAIFELHKRELPAGTFGAIIQGHIKQLLPHYGATKPEKK